MGEAIPVRIGTKSAASSNTSSTGDDLQAKIDSSAAAAAEKKPATSAKSGSIPVISHTGKTLNASTKAKPDAPAAPESNRAPADGPSFDEIEQAATPSVPVNAAKAVKPEQAAESKIEKSEPAEVKTPAVAPKKKVLPVNIASSSSSSSSSASDSSEQVSVQSAPAATSVQQIVPEKDAAKTVEAPAAKPVAQEASEPAAQASEAAAPAKKLDELSQELSANEDKSPAQPSPAATAAAQKEAAISELTAEQQTPAIYDTKKYHLPIKPSRHNVRKDGVGPILAAFTIALVIVVAGTIAIDLELVDIGIELPFDIL